RLDLARGHPHRRFPVEPLFAAGADEAQGNEQAEGRAQGQPHVRGLLVGVRGQSGAGRRAGGTGAGRSPLSWASMWKSPQIIGRASGSMCSTTSPPWKMRTAPDDWLTATATALVLRLMAAAAQWRVPRPLL